MKELYIRNKYRTGLKIAALSYDERSQDVILNKGVPIISKVNNEELGLFNNQRFEVTKIDNVFGITIKDKCGNEKNIKIDEFQRYFNPSYAVTTHSSQGMSISEPYTIHEWERMDQRLKYVALSRSREHSYIHIMK